MRTFRPGFTLVEMLVVIGIVMLLAAILSPVLAAARRAGHRVACLSNLRQLHAAFMLYVDDHDEEFPSTGNNYLWQGRLWRPLVNLYIGNRKSFWCPLDQAAKYKYDSTSYAYMQTFYHRPEDITPGNQGGFFTCSAPAEAQPFAQVAHPAQKILIYEWHTNHELPLRTMWDDHGPHMAVFVDGHAALLRQERLNLSVLGNHDPNWTVGGLAGKDIE